MKLKISVPSIKYETTDQYFLRICNSYIKKVVEEENKNKSSKTTDIRIRAIKLNWRKLPKQANLRNATCHWRRSGTSSCSRGRPTWAIKLIKHPRSLLNSLGKKFTENWVGQPCYWRRLKGWEQRLALHLNLSDKWLRYRRHVLVGHLQSSGARGEDWSHGLDTFAESSLASCCCDWLISQEDKSVQIRS